MSEESRNQEHLREWHVTEVERALKLRCLPRMPKNAQDKVTLPQIHCEMHFVENRLERELNNAEEPLGKASEQSLRGLRL